MKRFTLGPHMSAGWTICDGRNMSVGYYNADDEEDAQRFVDFRNLLHDTRVRLDLEEKELAALARRDFEGRRFGDAA